MTALHDRPLLDRVKRFDDRSRAYGIRSYVADTKRQTTRWEIPRPLPLNQGREGACVGFGWSGLLAVGPVENPTSNAYARSYYEAARKVDLLDGAEIQGDGATVLAGAKVAKARGVISTYRWAFGIDDVINTLCAQGPVVLGTNWYDSMYETERDGRIIVNGPLVGGHCYVASNYVHDHPVWGGNWIEILNSWGRSYGVAGRGWMKESDLAMLLSQQGEACVAKEIAPRRVEKPIVRKAKELLEKVKKL